MKYLCLMYVREALLDALPDGERAALVAESTAYEEALASRGQLVASHALQRASRASVVQVRQGSASRTDGAFADAKEQLSAFLLVEAPDLNAAIQIASNAPLARVGSIEVRPVAKVDRMEGSAP